MKISLTLDEQERIDNNNSYYRYLISLKDYQKIGKPKYYPVEFPILQIIIILAISIFLCLPLGGLYLCYYSFVTIIWIPNYII